jgi:hypothetical protein
MLVQRWGILWTAFPRNISVKKVISTVVALAKLHNFCISQSDTSEVVPISLTNDENSIMNDTNGYVKISVDKEHDTNVPLNLMRASHHFEDVPWNILANHRYILDQGVEVLPREVLHNFVATGHWALPTVHRKN